MSLNARSAYGSIFKFSSVGSTGTFTTLAGITQITPAKNTRTSLDITPLYSTDSYEDNVITGPIRTGTMSIRYSYLSTDSVQTGILDDCMEAGNKCGWLIQIAGTSSNNIWYGDCAVLSNQMQDLTIDGKVEFLAELKTKGGITGPVSSTT